MRHVYTPANAVEAHMLVHVLDQAGIKAQVRGEALTSAFGNQPGGGFVRLEVADEDYDRARGLLQDWEKSNPPAESELKSKKTSNVALGAFLLLGGVIGWGGHVIVSRHQAAATPSSWLDRNGDGKPDLTYFSGSPASPFATQSDADDNFDGEFDVRTTYGKEGLPARIETDLDFDGVFDMASEYKLGILQSSEIDTNGDKIPDVNAAYAGGNLSEIHIKNPQSGTVVRIDHYSVGLLVSADIDTDGDGALDTHRDFDRYGQPTSTRKIETALPN